MPHADASLVPKTIRTKKDFWEHVFTQLEALIAEQRHWVSNLANASALIYNSLLAFTEHFGDDDRAVNWCGFYINSPLYPSPGISKDPSANEIDDANKLLLGPFCGKPACQFINVAPGKSRGVCADAFLQSKTLVVPDVDQYPGHIACDGDTKSEIVVPLLLVLNGETVSLGVLDLDCLAVEGFDRDDQVGLERIAALIVRSCDW
ncbi:hypothetical protein HGRIS_002941 [Hohenbuehelia grisea]|uniref:GAF domain-containing protein n=1 Tax=Hohenbuehelia grisea TaxID=104357 RepID=A0ABR3JNY1_9AGAR